MSPFCNVRYGRTESKYVEMHLIFQRVDTRNSLCVIHVNILAMKIENYGSLVILHMPLKILKVVFLQMKFLQSLIFLFKSTICQIKLLKPYILKNYFLPNKI